MKTQILHMQPTIFSREIQEAIDKLMEKMKSEMDILMKDIDKGSFIIVILHKTEDLIEFSYNKQIFEYDVCELLDEFELYVPTVRDINMITIFEEILQSYRDRKITITQQEIPRSLFLKFLGFQSKLLLTFTLSEFGWGVFSNEIYGHCIYK